MPPAVVSSIFFPSFREGAALLDGNGAIADQAIAPASPAGRETLTRLLKDHDYVLGSDFTGEGREQIMKYSRSVWTFCRREGYSRTSESALYTQMAVQMGKDIAAKAQTNNMKVYYGGDFVYEHQVNEAAVHDMLVMGGGLIRVGACMTVHCEEMFVDFVDARKRGGSVSEWYWV